jgi:lipoic acid synthetase
MSDPFSILPRPKRLPAWLHRKLSLNDEMQRTGERIKASCLHTVCEEARCPNLLECYSKKVATFLLLGRECTRACAFCEIDFAKEPLDIDQEEPERIVEAINSLGLRHAVLTMVTRDDLADGGSSHIARTVELIHKKLPKVSVEVLTSDFQGNEESIRCVVQSGPHIFNHNVETVPRLTPHVRHKATYERSLEVLSFAKQLCPTLVTKSGLMVGLGEREEEVQSVLKDLKETNVSIVTIGQYLQPSKRKLPVQEYITPEIFEAYRAFGLKIGLEHVFSAPFVRSSYNAFLFMK